MDDGRIATPFEGRPAADWDDAAAVPAPLPLHETQVRPEWVDYNDHMSESCYLLVFGDNSDAFFRFFGVDEKYRATGYSLYTAETHLHNLGQAAVRDPVRLTLHLLDTDSKRLHIFHEMRHGDTGMLLATAEQLLLHVNTTAGRVAPLPEHLQHRLERIRIAHTSLPRPPAVGHVMGIPRSNGGDHGFRAQL